MVGEFGAVGGAGSIDPGNSPGILTAPSVDPTGGLGFNFEFTSLNPVFSNASASVNDLLRLIPGTPFSASLSPANVVNIYLNVAGVGQGQVYTGGFFTDADLDFLARIEAATFNYYVAEMDRSRNSTWCPSPRLTRCSLCALPAWVRTCGAEGEIFPDPSGRRQTREESDRIRPD